MRVAGSTSLQGDRAGAGFRFGRVQIVICLWIVSTVGTIATATAAPSQNQQGPFYIQGRYGKREDPYQLSFNSGSRYGRGAPTNSESSKSDADIVKVLPRADRFYLGPRYGKRAINNNKLQDSHEPSIENAFLKRFNEALGYYNREQSAERNFQTANFQPNRNTRDKSIAVNHPYEEDMGFEFSNQEKFDNLW